MNPEEILAQLNVPGVTIKTWCSFCNKREASGNIKFDIVPGTPVDLYICEHCLAQAKDEGFDIDA